MSVLLVSYDLRAPGRNYDSLLKALRSYTHCHALESTWFLDTTAGAGAVRDHLCKLTDANDQLFVFRLRKDWAACKVDSATQWLQSSSRTWD